MSMTRTDARIAEITERHVAEAVADLVRFREAVARDLSHHARESIFTRLAAVIN
jgi:hypothetical protein